MLLVRRAGLMEKVWGEKGMNESIHVASKTFHWEQSVAEKKMNEQHESKTQDKESSMSRLVG